MQEKFLQDLHISCKMGEATVVPLCYIVAMHAPDIQYNFLYIWDSLLASVL